MTVLHVVKRWKRRSDPASSELVRSPVVVVRGTPTRDLGPDCPVVVGADDSHLSPAAIRYAADAAARNGAPLVVVITYRPDSAPEPPSTMECDFGPQAAAPAGLGPDVHMTATATASAAVHLAQQLHPQLDIRAQVLLGGTADQLCTSAHHAGLLVVGTPGRGRLARLMCGSSMRHVITSAPCPVAVVPDQGPGEHR